MIPIARDFLSLSHDNYHQAADVLLDVLQDKVAREELASTVTVVESQLRTEDKSLGCSVRAFLSDHQPATRLSTWQQFLIQLHRFSRRTTRSVWLDLASSIAIVSTGVGVIYFDQGSTRAIFAVHFGMVNAWATCSIPLLSVVWLAMSVYKREHEQGLVNLTSFYFATLVWVIPLVAGGLALLASGMYSFAYWDSLEADRYIVLIILSLLSGIVCSFVILLTLSLSSIRERNQLISAVLCFYSLVFSINALSGFYVRVALHADTLLYVDHALWL